MAIVAVKSTSVTNLDASPHVMNTQGEGASAVPSQIDDYVTVPAAASATSVLRIVRIPTTAKVKRVIIESEAQGAGTVDVGLYYSASTDDSPGAAALAGAVVDADFFSDAYSLAARSQHTDITNEKASAVYTLDKRSLPIWQAAGLSADPGGFFDVALTVATDITTGTGRTGLIVDYVK